MVNNVPQTFTFVSTMDTSFKTWVVIISFMVYNVHNIKWHKSVCFKCLVSCISSVEAERSISVNVKCFTISREMAAL